MADNTNNQSTPPRRATGFQFSTLGDLFNAEPEHYDAVIEDLAPRGAVTLLGAKPKTGKSTLARNMAYGVARGEPVLGHETTQGKVLYLALEEKASEVVGHFKTLGADGTEEILLHIGMAPEDALLSLEEALFSVRPDFVVIDPMQRFFRIKDLNDYAQVSSALEPIGEMARNYNCHIMLVHHLGKNAGDGSLSDAFIGSTAIFASVDVGLLMLKTDDVRTLQTDGPQRFGIDIPPTVLNFDKETGRITAGQELSVAQHWELEQKVLNAMGDMRMVMADIKKAVGGDSAKLHSTVMNMHQSGLIERTGNGKAGDPYLYKVVTPPASTAEEYAEQVGKEAQAWTERGNSNPLFKDAKAA